MKLFREVEKLIRSKEAEYGDSTHQILSKLTPNFRPACAIKHLISYMRTGRVEELVKAGAYVAFEYEEASDVFNAIQ